MNKTAKEDVTGLNRLDGGGRNEVGVHDDCRVLSPQNLKENRKRSRFQKEDGGCGLKVSEEHSKALTGSARCADKWSREN